MRPISNDIRKNIIEAKERNESISNIIKWFKISKDTIYRIWRKYKETGSYEAKPFPGKQSTFSEEINIKITKKIKEQPDITQEELIEAFSLNVTQAGLSKHLKKLGYTLKKRLSLLVENKEKMLLLKEKNGKENKRN